MKIKSGFGVRFGNELREYSAELFSRWLHPTMHSWRKEFANECAFLLCRVAKNSNMQFAVLLEDIEKRKQFIYTVQVSKITLK